MDDFDLLASNKTNESGENEQVSNVDFEGEFTSNEISQQFSNEPAATNETLFNTEIEELEKAEDSGDADNITKTDQWNEEPTNQEEETATSEEVFNSSFSVAREEPQIDERTARVQAINQRIEEELAARDEGEARRKADLLQQAKQDLQRWYEQRERQMNEKRQQMKSEEDTLRTLSLEKSDKNKCDWAKVIRLLEFGPGSSLSKSKRDLSRMKQSIINAKRQTETNNSSNGV